MPDSWKRAVVLPLHKRDDPTVVSNFRPITLTPTICKLVEKLVHEQLVSYLNAEGLINSDQHGFLAKHSTCTALLTVTDAILRGMDQSEVTILTLLDLSRCFDVIDHANLLAKLQQHQVSPGWFKSYLGGHTQRVRVGDALSAPLNISIGTFQGTCLGALLFNITSNDIACHVPTELNGFRITFVRYADDTQIAITGPRARILDMKTSLESILNVLQTWFMQNGMLINASKTEILLCGDRRQLTAISVIPTIRFMNQELQCSSSVKNLGVIMDQTLSWELHVTRVTNRCIGILIALSHVKHILPPDVLPRLIDALVFSHIRYCVQVYGSANLTVIAKVQKVFNLAARVLSGRRKYDHISDVLRDLEWLDAQQFVKFSDICLLHKILTSGEPCAIRSSLSYNHETIHRTTRQSDHLNPGRAHNNHGKRLFTYRAASLYNQFVISENIDVTSIRMLKRHVRAAIYRV